MTENYNGKPKHMKPMQKCKLQILTLVMAVVMATAGFLALFLGGGVQYHSSAFTTSTIGSATRAGNADLWDSASGTFNENVARDLLDKLFGDDEPVDYIKKNGADDYNTYGKNSPTANKGIPYYLIPATKINAKVGNVNNGLVVKLGGKDWIAASLTLANIGSTTDNVILTLYLANDSGSSQFYSDSSSVKGNNMYSSSILRKHLLTDSNWSLFNTTTTGSFAQRFLVQPKYIQYQHTETLMNRIANNGGYTNPNDALDDITAGWLATTYHPEDAYTGAFATVQRHDAWGEDYIWVPSVTETGVAADATTAFLWKLTENQLAHDAQSHSWQRSGSVFGPNGAFCLPSTGVVSADNVDKVYGVRPAIHLNLSPILPEVKLDNPQNVTTTYNGGAQTIKTIYDTNNASVSWYIPQWYNHTGNYVAFTYYDAEGNATTSVTNAGDYWVKTEITNAWINAVNATVDAAGEPAALRATRKELKKPCFKGAPDTSDSDHPETRQERWFKLTVNKKEVTVNAPSYNAGTGAITDPTFANMSEVYADAPTLGILYTGTAADGTVINQINELPNQRGSYTATAIFVDPTTEPIEEATGINYTMKGTPSCAVVIGFNRQPLVASAEASKPYTGSAVQFALTGYSSGWTDNAELTLPSGVTLTGNDTDGWYLTATEAGEYTITQSIKPGKRQDWCWNVADQSETPVTDQTFKITVAKKRLEVAFTSSSGAFSLRSGETVTLGAEPSSAAGNVVNGDEVKLTLYYATSADYTAKIPVGGNELDASTFAMGTYRLYAVLEDGVGAQNKNYEIDGGEAWREFTITAANITLSGVSWQYTQNNGAATLIADGEGASAGAAYEVTYNGSAYVFAIDTTGLAVAGVKIDASYGTNGYTNSVQKNAMSSAVAVTVRLIPLGDSYAFADGSAQKDYTLYVKVNKADADFTNVVWSAEELEFNASTQKVEIVSGLPSYLKATYSASSSRQAVGDYTAKVTMLAKASDEADNYNYPTTTAELDAVAELTHAWKIVKRKITVSWTHAESESGGTVVWVPALSDNSLNAVEYVYYNEDGTQEMTFQEILDEYSETEPKDYFVHARLKTSGTYNATNCVFVNGNGEEVADPYISFTVGASKTPVQVGLVKDKVVYNGSEQPAEYEFEGGNLTEDDFTLTYTQEDGTPLEGEPKNAGKYKVKISLNAGDEQHAITGQREFDYEIEKASYDLSGFRWVDEESGEEYTSAYTWAHGVSHKMAYQGEKPEGLDFVYTADTEDNLTKSKAGTYPVVVEFTVADSANYNVPDDVEFEWEITPYTPDLSNVRWNYSEESPFVYHRENGAATEYSVYLTGLPDGFDELIIYSGNTGTYTNAGGYVTEFKIDESSEERGNYGELVFGGGLETRLAWTIESLTPEKPEQRQTEPFRPEGYPFEEITGLPEDYAEYFDVQVLDSEGEEIEKVDGTWVLKNADLYRILISFKEGMNRNNGGTADNVKWSDNGRGAYQVYFTIEQLVFEIEGWIDGTENGRAELDASAEETAAIEEYFEYVLVNTETGETLSATATLEYETVYTIALKLKAEYEGNVAVKYRGKEGEETEPYAFMTDVNPLAPPPNDFYRKPTEEERRVSYRYTGSEIEFELGTWFVPEKMQVLHGGVMKGTEEGEYQVRVGFKRGALAAWEPASAVPADRAPVTITFVISADVGLADRFILKDGITVPFVFLYDDFTSVGAIEDYAFNADKLAYVSRLSLGDTLSALLSQFENGADITVYDLDGTTVITDLETVVATGMYLRLMDGETMLNQLILSVLGELTGDGVINSKDKAQFNAYTLGKMKLTPAQLLASDITGDGVINSKDKAQLNSYTLGTTPLPVTPLPVPAASSVSEVWEGAEVAEMPVFISINEVTEEVPARTTSTQPTKVGFTTVATDHRAATSQFVFTPDSAKKKYLF